MNIFFRQDVLEGKNCQLFMVNNLSSPTFCICFSTILTFFFVLQYVFRTKSFEERTIHEELAKNMTGLLKLNDQVTVKQVLKVNDAELAFVILQLLFSLKLFPSFFLSSFPV